MPSKLNLTPEELAARKRAQAAERNRRYNVKISDDAKARKNERTRLWRAAHPETVAASQAKQNEKRNAERATANATARQDLNWRDHRRKRLENISPLGIFIDNEMRLTGRKLKELSVLSINHDPFRFDTASAHRNSQWVAEQLGDISSIHIRGLHYRIVARGSAVMPNGTCYINDDESYAWLNIAVKSARWLGYVPFERIIDNRNDAPVIAPPEALALGPGRARWEPPSWVSIPDFELGQQPEIYLSGGDVAQPYRIIFIGEKSSLRDELEPLRQRVNGELILPSGELSDTLVYGMAARAAIDPRPSVVLYFADFDPSGYQMPVSLARRLQALKVLYWPDLEIQVRSAALDLETCIRLNLPSTPLRETELRGDRWRERFGREQTEIDALAALHPGELRRIARDAVAPFFDFTLAERLDEAQRDWYDAAQQVLGDSAEYQSEIWLLAERQAKAKAQIAEAISDINTAQDTAMEHVENLGLKFDPFEPPEVEITTEAPRPLFDSQEPWAEQTRRLRKWKALGDDDP
jgi:hypothetical protein